MKKLGGSPGGGGDSMPLVALVPLRVLTGLVFLHAGWQKLHESFIGQHHLSKQLERALVEGTPYLWYARLLREQALPHATFLSYVIVYGELALGAALVVGLFARPMAVFGLLGMVAITLERGFQLSASGTVAFAVIFLTLAMAASGRVMGLDARLRGRLPAWLV